MFGDLYKVKGEVEPLDDDIIAIDMESGLHKMASGIILLDDNGKNRGIRPRWCKIYKVGKNITDVSSGEYALVEHGRWTYRHIVQVEFPDNTVKDLYIQKIDPNGIMGVYDEESFDKNLNFFAQKSSAIDMNSADR